MTIDPAALAAAFLEAYGPGLDVARAEAAIATALAAATCPNEIARRRADQVFATVERDTGIPREEITSPDQSRRACAARDAVMWALRQYHFTLASIGLLVGRDHRTVVDGIRRHERRMAAAVQVQLRARGGAR